MEVTCFGVPSKVVLGIESGPNLAEALFHGRFQRRAWVELAPGLWPARRASEFLAVAEDLMMARATTAGLADLFTVRIGRDDLDVAAGTDGAVFVSLREDSAAAVLAAIRDEIATGRWPGGAAHDRWLRQWHGARPLAAAVARRTGSSATTRLLRLRSRRLRRLARCRTNTPSVAELE